MSSSLLTTPTTATTTATSQRCKIRLALDWTPNCNQSGIHAAIHHGWYQQAGIDLELIPHDYQQSPAQKVITGVADVAICAMECLLSYHQQHEPQPPLHRDNIPSASTGITTTTNSSPDFSVVPSSNSKSLQAIAAILQKDLSSIAVLESSGIQRPAQLDGTIHASYKACNKDTLVTCLVQQDGGKGHVQFEYPGPMGIWEALLEHKAHSTWIFQNWQGIQAQCAGIAVRHFKMKDYGIPYTYSPVFVTSPSCMEHHATSLQAFLKATAKGYTWATHHPHAMAELLYQIVPETDRNLIMLKAAQNATSPHYLTTETGLWGYMDLNQVDTYLQWLYEQGLETKRLNVHDIVTNELLSSSLP